MMQAPRHYLHYALLWHGGNRTAGLKTLPARFGANRLAVRYIMYCDDIVGVAQPCDSTSMVGDLR